ncbi:fluoride efflux transporter FluC [Brevibacterium jeotgali]|uniref:Fluoride-specific ion channel FluC n=1 Tax=Brevibacterium jeotgali TaxID=1262550 RepID=A0A2H1L2T0_9MICO|nr:CrcB family protein [Brevibacterium jeotgali]TWC03087.1 camphor resistance protein CrcB [Brevibacterium jeotgali]SMY11110.1 CrcB protein [Brevibacterium jeotgali]
MTSGTPLHRRPGALALVFLGGAAGTGARVSLTSALPLVAGVPAVTVGINVIGAFVLGLLVETLIRRGPDTGTPRRLRLLLGTGFLGGFTTYSALSLDTVLLLTEGRTGIAALYGLGSVVLGLLAAAAGVACATRGRRPDQGTHPAPEAGGAGP